jgi:hypothetical protein
VQKFFDHARTECSLSHTRLVASARLDALTEAVKRDEEIQAVIDAGTPTVVLSACCWHAGTVGFEEYCRRIQDAVRILKAHALEVIFRDEDFFQCFAGDASFALRTLEMAKTAGADALCLGDSTGSGVPHLVREASMEVRKRFEGTLGICAHDDSDLALANTLEAVEQGFTHVEGSMDAYGARRGLANLSSVISSLEHRYGHTTIGAEKLDAMAEVARLVSEAGTAAVGRRIRVGLARVPCADQRPFLAEHYEVATHSGPSGGIVTTATATLRIGQGTRSETEEGDSAIHALERSLRQCLFALFPEVAEVQITDFSLAVIDPAQGTSSPVRVTVAWSDSSERWVTSAVAADPVQAAWLALTDGFLIPLARLGKTAPAASDCSWAV